MSINGIPAGMSLPIQPYGLTPQRVTMLPLSAMAMGSPAAMGARLVGDDGRSSHRIVRALKAALAELGIGRSAASVPLQSTMPMAPAAVRTAPAKKHAKPHRAAHAQSVHVKPRSGVPVGTPRVMTRPMAPMLSPYGLPGMGMNMAVGAGTPPARDAGVPQLNASNQSGVAMGMHGLDQHVTNDNTLDDRGYSTTEMPFGMSPWSGAGFGYGVGAPYASVMGWSNPMGYAPASPYSAYGASMTGAYYTQSNSGGIRGFFNRLLGR